MSEYALVITDDDEAIRFDAESMRDQIVVRWPGTEVFPGPAFDGDTAVFHANVATEPSVITIYLDQEGQMIGIEPSAVDETTEFVPWALTFLSTPGTHVTLYGADFSTELEVTPATSADDIRAFLAAS